MRAQRAITRTILASTVAVGAFMSAGASFAQTAQAPGLNANSPTPVQELVVTAEKREERLFEVPLAVTALQGDQLQLRQELDLSGLVGQVPGLSMEQDGPESNRLILRGENTGGAGATVAITVDDVPFSYSSAEADGSLDTANFETYDLNRIEVLRGPQGTLYGAAAEGGILRYITNAPDPTGFRAGLETGVENVDQGQTAVDVKGFVNIPLGDKFALRVVGYYDQLPGYIGNWYTGEKNANSGVKEGWRLAALWRPTNDFTIRAGAFYQSLENHGSNFVDLVGQALTPQSPPANRFSFPQGLSFGSQAPSFAKNPTFESYLSLQYDLHWATLTSITSYGEMRDSSFGESQTGYFLTDANGNPVPLTFQQYLGDFVYGQPVIALSYAERILKKYSEELRLSSDPGFRVAGHDLEWTAGVFLTREVTSPFDGFFPIVPLSSPQTLLSPPFGSFNDPSSYDEFSAFAQATYHFNPTWDISVGGRFTHVDQSNTIFYGNGLFTTGLAGNETFGPFKTYESSETWSVAPRWHLDQNNLIYFRVATGFRPGGPATPIPNPPPGYPTGFHPDSTVNYELGWRSTLFDNHLSVDLAAYYIDWTAIQIVTQAIVNGGSFVFTGNGGEARTDGVEWSFRWTPLTGLDLGVVGSWTNAELTTDALTLGGNKGDRLPFVPPITNSVNADYSWPWFARFKGFVGGTWTYVGDVYTNFVFPGSVPLSGARTKLPAYNTVDLHGGVRDNRWTVEVFVKNLNNSHALTDYISGGAFGPNYSVYGSGPIIQPRTIGLRLAFSY